MLMARRPTAEQRQYWDDQAPRSMNARAYAALWASDRTTCEECGWRGNYKDLRAIHHVHERVGEGDTMFAGDCPRCGTTMWTDEQLARTEREHQRQEAARDLLAALQQLVDRVNHVTRNAGYASGFFEPEMAEAQSALRKAQAAGLVILQRLKLGA